MNSDEVPHAVPLTEEEQWDLQMKRLEEIDRLTTEAEQNIPLELRSTLLVLIKKFPGLQRLPAFQLMGSYDWNLDRLTALSDVLHRIPNSKILATVDFLLSLIKIEDNQWKLHYLGLHIFSQLKAQYIVEWSTEVSENNRIFLMQIARHLSPTDLELMIYNIHELSVQEMIDMIQSIQQNPERKQCELCRQKRLFSLEYRMRTDTMPKQHLPTPGIIPYLDRNVEYWGADDEKLFSFDLENGQIFWNQSYPVNLIDICEQCLLDSHQAITNQGRNDAIYHLPPDQRKDAYSYQRLVEQGLATMVSKVAKERTYRRLREFAIQAINSQKSGIKVEDDEKEAILIKMKQEEELLQKKKERELLNEQALAVDEKWFDNDEMTTRKDLDKRRAYTLLKFHLGYDGEKTLAPTARKRRTWRLQDFDSAGLPLNASAANRMFGISHEIDVDDGPRIDYWKIISEERMANLKEKERIKKQLQREKELEEIQQLKNYVNDRMITLNKYGLQQQRLTEENERRRQLERLEAKERRRKEKYEKYLQYEKNCLEYEDYRSYQLREYSYELGRELMERENMFNEELEQTEMDRFWGFDVYYQRMKVEENRLHDFYIQQIQEKNHQLSIMRCTKKIPKKYFTSYLPSIAKAATVMKTDFTIPPPSPEQIIMRNSSKIPTLPAIVSPKENLSSKPSYTLQSPTTSILKSGGVLSSSIDSLTPSKQSVNFASNSKETDTMNSYDERDQKEEAAKVTLKVDLSQLQSLSRPMSKQEMYEYQYEVNEYEKQKHLQYIKQLKAEEIRVKTRAKLRTPVYSR